jgi:hypothetical protein
MLLWSSGTCSFVFSWFLSRLPSNFTFTFNIPHIYLSYNHRICTFSFSLWTNDLGGQSGSMWSCEYVTGWQRHTNKTQEIPCIPTKPYVCISTPGFLVTCIWQSHAKVLWIGDLSAKGEKPNRQILILWDYKVGIGLTTQPREMICPEIWKRRPRPKRTFKQKMLTIMMNQ